MQAEIVSYVKAPMSAYPGTLRYVHMHIALEAKDFMYAYMDTISVTVYVCIYLHVP